MRDNGNATHDPESERQPSLVSRLPDQLVIVDWHGLIGMVPALICLPLGLLGLAVFLGSMENGVTSVVKGQPLASWVMVIVFTLVGVSFTYLGLGFLTFARCTRFDRTTRSGEQWFRLIHRWQREEFQLRDNSRIIIDLGSKLDSPPRRYQAWLTTAGKRLKLSEGYSKSRIAEHCRQVSEFVGIPVVDRTI